MFQSLVWWIRGFKPKSDHSNGIGAKFQSLVWWIRGFKLFRWRLAEALIMLLGGLALISLVMERFGTIMIELVLILIARAPIPTCRLMLAQQERPYV